MTPHAASLLNAVVLIVFSGWGYLASETPSLTALIPAIFGLALLACYSGVKSQNKAIAHVAVGLTLIVLLALIMPLRGTISRGDGLATFRVIVMMVFTAISLFAFVKSFIEARRNRA